MNLGLGFSLNRYGETLLMGPLTSRAMVLKAADRLVVFRPRPY